MPSPESCDGDHDIAVVGRCAETKGALVMHGLVGVGDQVGEDLAHLGAIGGEREAVGLVGDGHPWRRRGRLENLPHELLQVARAPAPAARSRI